ncbi:Osmosensitive K+ channel histidine kinase KdpD [Minicystis rosea]|nr:Osmosensitive K+ channel histidine kinase KdpD [Minicystis rosea]
MRLVTRLVLSHVLLATILTVAIAFTLVSLIRITALVSDIQEQSVGDLEQEERLHRAAWEIEVAARRGIMSCARDRADEPSVAASMRKARSGLVAALEAHAPDASDDVRRGAKAYLAFADRMLAGDACVGLLEASSRSDRLELDEELTNAWIARMNVVRVALDVKEGEARRIGVRAIVGGVLVAALTCISAAVVARRFGRGITLALSDLARHARRVGEGDFSPLPPLDGAPEIRALSLELDRMRSRLAELDQLKQSFVASVSHDLRSPLGRLREALGLLADGTTGPLNERQARVVALARAACEREIRLVSALLDLSRVRAGRPIKREAGVSVDRVIASAIDDVAAEATDAGVRVDVAAADELAPGSLDGPLVERAIVNILSNAISVSPRGGSVRIARRSMEEDPGAPGRWVEIVIADDGPGVSPELRGRIFEPFVSATVGSFGGRGGIGLGLSIAREMIRAHGGQVVLLDEARAGATFAIRLPLDAIPDLATMSPAAGPRPIENRS